MDGIRLAGCYACAAGKARPVAVFQPPYRADNQLSSSGKLRLNLTKYSLYEAFPLLPVKHVLLAPARPAPVALFVVGLLQDQTASAQTPSNNAGKLPEPVTLISFDEGTGTYAADSVGDSPATLMGNAGWTTGLVGPYALALPGAAGSYADVANTVLDTTESFSVAAWVKLNNTSGYQTFVSEDTPGGEAAFFLQLRAGSGQFSFTVPNDFFTNPQSLFAPVSGQWYHLAGVYDATNQSASLY